MIPDIFLLVLALVLFTFAFFIPGSAGRAGGGAAPALGVVLGVQAQRPEGQEPDDEGEGPPGAAGEEAAAGGDERRRDQHAPAAPLEALREVEGLHEREGAVAGQRR